MAESGGLPHRTVSGWISDFSSIPRWEPWPGITLDERLTADLYEAFGKAREAGYTGIILWGLLCGRSWSSHLPDTVSEPRRCRVLAILEQARHCGLKALMGLGVYSWGFDEIVAHHPELDGGMPTVMCGSRLESHAWMERVLDFVLGEYDPDGLSLQSADQGRCPCDACQAMGSLAYHAALNDRVAAYVRSRWPGKLIEISTWGMDLGHPDNLPYVQQMTAHADILNDFNNSSARHGAAYRRTLIGNLHCAFGTEAGWWVDPPPFWDRAKWFLPFALRNVPYYRELVADGARAVQRYILPLANPGAEVGFLFDGLMLADVGRDPLATLGQVLDGVFEPRTAAARAALLETWHTAEDGYLDNAREGDAPQVVGLTRVHYNHTGNVPPVTLAERPEYLLRMQPEGLASYGRALGAALEGVRKVRGELGNEGKAVRLERTIALALSDVQRVQAWKATLTR